MHLAAKSLYEDLPDSVRIRNWSEAETLERVQAAVASAIPLGSRHMDAVLRQLMRLEAERVSSLLQEFVVAEKARDEFRVAAVENTMTFEHAGVMLELRFDRVDRLADGSALIADYKTGSARPLLNKQGEPADLQLVVYSCSWQGSVGGLLLINLDRNAISYKGTGSSTQWHRPRDEDWHDRLIRWQQLVYSAIEAFARGDARINLSLARENTRELALLSRIEELRREL